MSPSVLLMFLLPSPRHLAPDLSPLLPGRCPVPLLASKPRLQPQTHVLGNRPCLFFSDGLPGELLADYVWDGPLGQGLSDNSSDDLQGQVAATQGPPLCHFN